MDPNYFCALLDVGSGQCGNVGRCGWSDSFGIDVVGMRIGGLGGWNDGGAGHHW
jgi:hypothetical protein